MKTTINKESAVDYLMSNLETCGTKEDFTLILWEYWTDSVTVNSREFQQVFANASVNKWFLMELAKEQKEVELLAARYPEIKPTDKVLLYCKCVSKLMSRFPISLLQNAKKRTEKPQITRVEGFRIEISILNQN